MGNLSTGKSEKNIAEKVSFPRYDLVFGYSKETSDFRRLLAAAQIPAILYRFNRMMVEFPGILHLFYDGFEWRDVSRGYSSRNTGEKPIETGVLLAGEVSLFSRSTSGIRARDRARPAYAFPSGIWLGDRMVPLFSCAGTFLGPNVLAGQCSTREKMESALERYMQYAMMLLFGDAKVMDQVLYAVYRMEIKLGEKIPFPLPDSIADRIWKEVSNLSSPVLTIGELSEKIGLGGYSESVSGNTGPARKETAEAKPAARIIKADPDLFPWMASLAAASVEAEEEK